MNSQKTKMPGDAAAMKKEYMRYLELQAQNNQKNLNASLLYRIQGQPSVQQPDYMTLTEKLADQVKLRVTLRQELLKVTDDSNSGQIAATLDANELRYVVQKMPRLIKFFELEYAIGVPADIFLLKIRQDMKAQEELQAQEGLGVSLSASGGVVYTKEWADDKLDMGQLIVLAEGFHRIAQLLSPPKLSSKASASTRPLVEDNRLLMLVEAAMDAINPVFHQFLTSRQGLRRAAHKFPDSCPAGKFV